MAKETFKISHSGPLNETQPKSELFLIRFCKADESADRAVLCVMLKKDSKNIQVAYGLIKDIKGIYILVITSYNSPRKTQPLEDWVGSFFKATCARNLLLHAPWARV